MYTRYEAENVDEFAFTLVDDQRHDATNYDLLTYGGRAKSVHAKISCCPPLQLANRFTLWISNNCSILQLYMHVDIVRWPCMI